ncbi:hypothetical protein BOW53_06825 [Solemya pervernicosa gill symbiont]|uniref:Uncharacterized protein n=1 Tax=Solemya pervernicosa gill symbiont TaxID=642797 RepID=A0A1T2L6Z2_9GAMM|nr:tetratricopeptide repeat protein [Solemya pervernicosa gill symbiont]OOZ40716.1 hypothetical protein BOW53_06825 [Solemya pervernicosa gill symbiont]
MHRFKHCAKGASHWGILLLLSTLSSGCVSLPTIDLSSIYTPSKREQSSVKQQPIEPPQTDIRKAVGKPQLPPKLITAHTTALTSLQQNRLPQAAAQFQAITTAHPTLATPFANLGLTQMQQGEHEAALVAFKRAIEIDPQLAVVHNEIALLHRQAGRFKAAQKAYQQALLIDPELAIAHRNIGILHDIYLQDLTTAQHHYQRYLELAPEHATETRRWLADIDQRLATTTAQR